MDTIDVFGMVGDAGMAALLLGVIVSACDECGCECACAWSVAYAADGAGDVGALRPVATGFVGELIQSGDS